MLFFLTFWWYLRVSIKPKTNDKSALTSHWPNLFLMLRQHDWQWRKRPRGSVVSAVQQSSWYLIHGVKNLSHMAFYGEFKMPRQRLACHPRTARKDRKAVLLNSSGVDLCSMEKSDISLGRCPWREFLTNFMDEFWGRWLKIFELIFFFEISAYSE